LATVCFVAIHETDETKHGTEEREQNAMSERNAEFHTRAFKAVSFVRGLPRGSGVGTVSVEAERIGASGEMGSDV
jgi:hypothetical protein